MVDAEQFVDGRSIRGAALAATVVGGVFVEWWLGFWAFIDAVWLQFQLLLTAPINRLAELITLAFGMPGETLLEASDAAAAWITSMGSALGLFAFPLVISVTMLTVWIVGRTLRWMGVL